jgi:hypothetical protein
MQEEQLSASHLPHIPISFQMNMPPPKNDV